MVVLFVLCYMKYETEGNFAGINGMMNADENEMKNIAKKIDKI